MIYTLEQAVDRYAWWASLKHGGLLIAPSRLAEFFVADIEPLSSYIEDRLRRDVTRVRNGEEDISTLLDTVLQDVLKLSKDWWIKGSAVDSSWSQRAITGETIRPRRVWQDPHGGVLPVFVPDVFSRLGIGKGRRAVSRVIEWLRKANQKIALLTNGRQWRLIHAGSDYDAWCEWDIDLWFEEGKPGLQVLALRLLLGEQSLHPVAENKPSPLITAIQASRQGQAELSDVLGERVRKAVELLIKESSPAIADSPEHIIALKTADNPVSNRDIYIAATRMIMRCVVILFAEARDLLDRTNQIYYDSYSISGLREQLERLSGGRAGDRLRNGYSAWSRLLALFRLVYFGCSHEKMPIPRYGGGLFTPGDAEAKDPILRALAAFENPDHTPSDAVVYRILELLSRSKVKVRQGRSSTWVEAPVDFSDLSSEYIGILYEGLLDFELRRAGEQEPILFLNLGDQPALPLSRLEGMDDAALAALVEKLKQKSKVATSEDEEEAEEEEVAEIESEAEETEEIEAETPADTELEDLEADGDLVQELRERAYQWAVRAVKAGKLVAKPRSKKAAAVAEYEQTVSKVAKNLIVKIVLPGEWFLVRWGGTRKGSGTFYTRPQLVIPTTRRTLQALVYEKESLIPKKPEEILALKVCDPAMGSGSFLVAALRFLTESLYESLHYHNRIEAHGNDSLCRLADGTGTNSLMEETLPVLPDHPDFEGRLKALLKRYIVERCIYGVDIDPLAVELGRLSLWVETMDGRLPFSFVDHKLKCGNSLVGCWFDRFQDYPAMAWEREGGDKNHDKFVHHFREYVAKTGKKKGQQQISGDKWTQAIKDTKNDIVKPELKRLIAALDPERRQQLRLDIPQFDLPQTPEEIHDEALAIFEELHSLRVDDTEERERRYQERIQGSETIHRLKFAFDTWCAVWFWFGEKMDIAPTPGKFFNPPAETKAIIERLAAQYQFFHWELEFPDVFASVNAGFDAIIGNPPWEIQKPNSKEFFSNIDPLYRTYGKQEALNKQQEYFRNDPIVEKNWLAYCDRLKALSNWNKQVAFPFGDEDDEGEKFSLSKSKKENENLHEIWRKQRAKRKSYAEPNHPFQYQGSADINTYKMFTELGYALLRDGGSFSFITPSGLYSDKGTKNLRELFLNRCQWTHLYAFQNERFVFGNIHHSFKMVVFTITKGGYTTNILTRFRLGPGDSPEAYELETDILGNYYILMSTEQIKQFSPEAKALLEICNHQDLQVIRKIYAQSSLLNHFVQFTSQFDMTNDSKLFTAADNININQYNEIYLPLVEGKSIHQFDPLYACWISGRGLQAKWEMMPYENKKICPQYWMKHSSYVNSSNYIENFYIVYRKIARSTDERSMIATTLFDWPSTYSLCILKPVAPEIITILNLSVNCNSFVFDFIVRQRLAGINLTGYVLRNCPVLENVERKIQIWIAIAAASLSFIHRDLSYAWMALSSKYNLIIHKNLDTLKAITRFERLRLRCILDSIIAELYGLTIEDFKLILQDCDYPASLVCDSKFARTLNPKGFWRVDKEKDPELRHTVLSLIAFHKLKEIGLEAFLNLNDGEGWMLPETLRLADYRLGRDERANQPQPVASRLGERFLPWQLEGTPEESWKECELHAENLTRLLGAVIKTEEIVVQNNFEDSTELKNPIQLNLFGNT